MEDIFQAGELGESINKMLVKIDNVLKTVEASNVSSPGRLGTTMPSVSQPMHPSSSRAKLPKLSLKKFLEILLIGNHFTIAIKLLFTLMTVYLKLTNSTT